MAIERKLYEKIKEYYDILGVDENVDDIKLKKAYRFAAKKYHPDANANNKEAAEANFKKASEAYKFLSDRENRKLYSTLKDIYGKQEKTTKREHKSEHKSEHSSEPFKEKSQEYTNKYIFQRRDGSKIEIIPSDRYIIDGEKIYQYRVIQYYKNMTIIDEVFGRINLAELLRNINYCDFCVNNLLSRENIYKSQVSYNGYIGYIEAAYRNGMTLYRITDKDSSENFDMSIEVGEIRYKNEGNIDLSEDDYDIWMEDIGTIIVNGKKLTQYFVFADALNVVNIIYSEDIDFNKINRNPKYSKAITKMLLGEERLKQKVSEGGYVGQVVYNAETNDYDIVVDKEIEKELNTKSKKTER